MPNYNKQKVCELFDTLRKSYNLLSECTGEYVEENQGEHAKSEIKAIMEDITRCFPSASLGEKTQKAKTKKVVKAFETLGTWVEKLPESEEKDFVVEAFHDLCEAWKKYRLDEKKKP